MKDSLKRGLALAKEKTASAAKRTKRGFVELLRRRDPAEYFILLLILGFTVFAFRCLTVGHWAFGDIFFKQCQDQFMDFFHSLRDVAQGPEVYSVRHVIYPPLANVVLWMLSRLVPSAYLHSGSAEAVQVWRFYPTAILALVVFMVLALLTLALVLQREKYSPVKRNLLTFFTIASFPIIFMIERGNVVVLCLIALMVFAQNYDSESKVGRELGIFMLALSAGLKIYPAIFGLALLVDKRYGEAIRAAIYSFVLFLIPSFFFGGPLFCARWLIRNTLSYSSQAGAGAIQTMGSAGGGSSELLGKLMLYGLYVLAVVVLVLCSLVQKKRWKTWALCASILLTVPSIFSCYNWVLMLPALFTFLRTEKLRGINWVYFFAMSLPFYVFIPKIYQDNGVITLMVILIAFGVFDTLISYCKERKSKAAEVA